MEPIELILKIWNIEDQFRDEVEDILKNTPPEHSGLSLAYMTASSDDDATEDKYEWMQTYLPEVKMG